MSHEKLAAKLAREQATFSAELHPLMGREPLTYEQCYRATLAILEGRKPKA